MSVERVTYLDSSAIVKLTVQEPESAALRRFLRRRTRLVSSALAQTEVARALMAQGPEAVRRGRDVLQIVSLVRLNDHVLALAGQLLPAELRSLDAIHLATALILGNELGRLVTYDIRLAAGARGLKMRVVSPS
jgi:predicted nucleic acid-binding protein